MEEKEQSGVIARRLDLPLSREGRPSVEHIWRGQASSVHHHVKHVAAEAAVGGTG